MKITKRLFSILLSLLMVVSTLPMTAITASAANGETTPSVQYLVDKIGNDFNAYGGDVEWTTAPDGVQAAYFDGTAGLYFNAQSSVFNNMNSNNQTISFATYALNGNDNDAKYFDICTKDPSSSNADSVGNRSISCGPNKTRISCFSDSSWHPVVSKKYTTSNNQWVYWTITMTTKECYVYKNGVLEGKLENDSTEAIGNGGNDVVTKDQYHGQTTSAKYLAIGMNSLNDKFFKGYIRDFRIYYNDYTNESDAPSLSKNLSDLAEESRQGDWQVVKSTNFADVTLSGTTTSGDFRFNNFDGWTSVIWGNSASKSSNGVYVEDGFLYSDTLGSEIKKLDNFKIEYQFTSSSSANFNTFNNTSLNSINAKKMPFFMLSSNTKQVAGRDTGVYSVENTTGDNSYNVLGLGYGGDVYNHDSKIGSLSGSFVPATMSTNKTYTVSIIYKDSKLDINIKNDTDGTSTSLSSSSTTVNLSDINRIYLTNAGHNNFLKGITYKYFNLYKYVEPITEISDGLLKKVDDAMKAFEDMADNGFLYNNTKPAYEAYVALQKARDAAKYGNDKAAINSLDEKATTLDAEVRKMTGFNYPTATATAYYGTNAATGLYSNVLYSDQTVGKGGQTANFNGWSAYVQMLNNTNYVLMYDGVNEASAPIYLRWKHANTTNYLFYCFPVNSVNSTSANDYFKLNQYWIGNRWSGDATQDGTYFGEHANGQKLNYTERDDDKYGQYSLGNYTFYYKNKLIYKGTGNTTSYYEDISSIPFQIKAYAGTDWSSAQNNSSKKKIFYPTLPSGNHIYVINYKALRDKLEAEKDSAVLKSIKNYSEGGAKSYINNLNSAMLVKPSSYSYSSGVRLAVLVCATDISTAIANLNSSASTSTANNTGYASIRTALNTAMSITEQDTYCPSRWTAFSTARANAMNAMKTVNTNGYTLSSDEAQELADALNTAETTLLKGHNWSLTERTPATCNAKGSEKYICTTADCGATKTEEIEIDSNAHNYGAWQSDKSSTYCYRQCSVCEEWDSRLHDSNTELPAVAATCTTTGLTKGYKCSVCGRVMVAQEIIPINDNHDYTLTVSNEGEVYTWTNVCSRDALHKEQVKVLDFSVYNAAVALANAKLAETAKYTADSLTALRNAVNNNTVVDDDKLVSSTLTDIQLDAKAAAITTAIEGLALNNITITVNYLDTDGHIIVNESYSKEVAYGSSNVLAVDSKYSVIKWVADYNGKDIKVAETAQSITAIVKSDVTYNVTVNDVSKPVEENTYAVKLYNRTNKLADIAYIPTGNYNVSISGNTITIGPYKLVAPNIVFYNIEGFQINGQAIVKGTTLSINSETNIKAVYTPAKTDLTITCVEGCTANVRTAYWNQKVVVTADNSIANPKWIVNGEVVAYGRTYTFMATTNVSVKCVDDDEVAQPVATVLSLGYGSMREKTISAVCSYYVPEGYKFKEAGVLLKTSAVNDNAAVNNVNNYTGANRNAKKFMATEFVNPTRQYVINVSSSTEYNSLYVGAVAYVVVEKDDEPQTFYSSLVTYDYVKPSQNA